MLYGLQNHHNIVSTNFIAIWNSINFSFTSMLFHGQNCETIQQQSISNGLPTYKHWSEQLTLHSLSEPPWSLTAMASKLHRAVKGRLDFLQHRPFLFGGPFTCMERNDSFMVKIHIIILNITIIKSERIIHDRRLLIAAAFNLLW